MGGLDALVFSTAMSPLAPLEEIDAQTWQDVIATNAIAPALVAQAAVDHLSDDGVIIFISSISTAGGYDGLAAYQASKAALDRTVRSWRSERPDRRFVCMAVGDTMGTEFARDFDLEKAAALFPKWLASNVIYAEPHAGRRPRCHDRPVRGDAAGAPGSHDPRAHHRADRRDDDRRRPAAHGRHGADQATSPNAPSAWCAGGWRTSPRPRSGSPCRCPCRGAGTCSRARWPATGTSRAPPRACATSP